MKLVLVQQMVMESAVTVVVTSGVYSSHSVTATFDDRSSVDNHKICTQLKVSVKITRGDSTVTEDITINGSATSVTVGNKAPVLLGDHASSPTGTTVTVTAAGQSSTMME